MTRKLMIKWYDCPECGYLNAGWDSMACPDCNVEMTPWEKAGIIEDNRSVSDENV